MLIGVDIGGTFTDLVLSTDGKEIPLGGKASLRVEAGDRLVVKTPGGIRFNFQ